MVGCCASMTPKEMGFEPGGIIHICVEWLAAITKSRGGTTTICACCASTVAVHAAPAPCRSSVATRYCAPAGGVTVSCSNTERVRKMASAQAATTDVNPVQRQNDKLF